MTTLLSDLSAVKLAPPRQIDGTRCNGTRSNGAFCRKPTRNNSFCGRCQSSYNSDSRTARFWEPSKGGPELVELLNHRVAYVTAELSLNPQTPITALWHIARRGPFLARKRLACRPNLPAFIVEELAYDHDDEVAATLAAYQAPLKGEMCEYLVSRTSDLVLGRLIEHSGLTIPQWEYLLSDAPARLINTVCNHHRYVPPEVMKLIAGRSEWSTLNSVATASNNADVQDALINKLEEFSKDGRRRQSVAYQRLIRTIVSNHRMSAQALDRLFVVAHESLFGDNARDSASVVLGYLARHLNASAHLLAQLAAKDTTTVNIAGGIVDNSNTDSKTLDHIFAANMPMEDIPQRNIVNKLIDHPNFANNQLVMLSLQDSSPQIAKRASQALARRKTRDT